LRIDSSQDSIENFAEFHAGGEGSIAAGTARHVRERVESQGR
jgi:hypothetical protein